MESAIRLCCCPLPNPPSLRLSYGSKGSQDARGSTLRLRFNHATLCLSHFNTSHAVASSFRHANSMLNSFFSVPSKNEGSSDNKILRGVTGVSLVLACILGLFNFSSKMNPKFNTAYAHELDGRLHLMNPISGGEVVIESLFKMINSEAAEHSGNKAPADDVKMHDIRPSKSGGRGEAIKILKKEYDKNVNDESLRTHEPRKELLELLIIQGNYEEARKLLDEQIGRRHPRLVKYEDKIEELVKSYKNEEFHFEKLYIAEILLYKAIAHTMSKDKEVAKEAAKWWEAFTKTLSAN